MVRPLPPPYPEAVEDWIISSKRTRGRRLKARSAAPGGRSPAGPITQHPDWPKLRRRIFDALGPFREAREALIRGLQD